MILNAEFFNRYEVWLRHSGATVARYLRTGVTDSQILALKRRGIVLPPQIAEFYMWHDGALAPEGTSLGYQYFIPGWIFMPISQAVTVYEDGVRQGEWTRKHFPIFTSGAGDFLIWEESKGELAGYQLMKEYDGLTLLYESFKSFWSTIERCTSEDVFFVDSERYLESRDDEEAKIASEENPLALYWMQ